VVSLICSNDKALKESKKRKHTEFGVPSLGVDPERLAPQVSLDHALILQKPLLTKRFFTLRFKNIFERKEISYADLLCSHADNSKSAAPHRFFCSHFAL
jgi:hypothetical protein